MKDFPKIERWIWRNFTERWTLEDRENFVFTRNGRKKRYFVNHESGWFSSVGGLKGGGNTVSLRISKRPKSNTVLQREATGRQREAMGRQREAPGRQGEALGHLQACIFPSHSTSITTFICLFIIIILIYIIIGCFRWVILAGGGGEVPLLY